MPDFPPLSEKKNFPPAKLIDFPLDRRVDFPPGFVGEYYRKSHDIDGSTEGAQTDYQMRITVHYGSDSDSGEDVYLNEHCRTDFGDVRFADSDLNELSYYLESKVDGNYAIFWVKVPSIPASPDSAKIYVYYGKLTEVYEGVAENVMFVFVGDIPSPYDYYWDVNMEYAEYFNALLPSYKTISRWWKVRQRAGYSCKIKLKTWYSVDPTHHHLDDRSDVLNISPGINTFNIALKGRGDLGRAFIGFIATANWPYFAYSVATAGIDKADVAGDASPCDTVYFPGFAANRRSCIQSCVRKYAEPEPPHGAWGSEERTGWLGG